MFIARNFWPINEVLMLMQCPCAVAGGPSPSVCVMLSVLGHGVSQDVNPYKSAIKKVLTEFIEAKSASNEQEEATGAPAETPAKRRRVLPPGSSQVDEVILGEEPEKIARKATVGSWKGRKNLDIREYYWDKKSGTVGTLTARVDVKRLAVQYFPYETAVKFCPFADTPDWKPTKKGIALQPGQWDTLVANMDAISNALSAEAS